MSCVYKKNGWFGALTNISLVQKMDGFEVALKSEYFGITQSKARKASNHLMFNAHGSDMTSRSRWRPVSN